MAGDEGCGGQHIVGDLSIDSPQVGEVEAAAVPSIPPGQQEVRGTAGLAGVGTRQVDKAADGCEFGNVDGGHGQSPGRRPSLKRKRAN
jgi:hypothetical protein